MSTEFAFVVIACALLIGIAYYVFTTRLREQIQSLPHVGAEQQKNIKEKRYHMGRRLAKPVNWRVLLSHEIQRHLPDQKTEAIIRYRQLTGADVQDATQTIAYHTAYPNHVPARFIHYDLSDEKIANLHKMLRQGKRADAHRRYQELTGIDQFAADIGLDILEQQVMIEEERFARLRVGIDAEADEFAETVADAPDRQTREQKG